MAWMELLKSQIESVYASADGLIGMVSDDELGWKPATGENWITEMSNDELFELFTMKI